LIFKKNRIACGSPKQDVLHCVASRLRGLCFFEKRKAVFDFENQIRMRSCFPRTDALHWVFGNTLATH